jgi:hypothetical protein
MHPFLQYSIILHLTAVCKKCKSVICLFGYFNDPVGHAEPR